jgi:hypothetical protein
MASISSGSQKLLANFTLILSGICMELGTGFSQECENPGSHPHKRRVIGVVDGGVAAINNPKTLLVKAVELGTMVLTFIAHCVI